ncbi:MAG: ATP-binding cassette domain-containing protein [Actinomycetota bacterium]
MITATNLTKRYGDKTAVDDLTFSVRPGIVTGFLGPNGAGKSTTMRMIVGLDRPTSGSVTVGGKAYVDQAAPMHAIGALLEARAVHTARSAYDHLLALGATTGLGRRRVDEVVDLVGLREVAHQRAGGFSLGMGQRLGIASALLGDPEVVMLDEPVNGLDLDGIRWIRDLLRSLAGEGRTVFVSSHQMSEMALTAEHLVVVGRGRLLADVSVAEMLASTGAGTVRVVTPYATELAALVGGEDVQVTSDERQVLTVTGRSSEQIGELALRHGLLLHELTPQRATLEEAFLAMTGDEVEYRSHTIDDTSRRAA